MTSRDIRQFNPELLAKLDADMWMAYYNHRFLHLFTLLLKLNYVHFRPSIFLTIRGAYHSAMAAIVFRKTKGHEDRKRVLTHHLRFYELLAAHTTHAFDFKKAAELELEWWFVDRYPDRYHKTRADALAAGMAVIYDTPATSLAAYGQARAEAMELLGDYHHDTAVLVEWPQLRRLLLKAYRALYEAVTEKGQ
jgi:hypothetical protein